MDISAKIQKYAELGFTERHDFPDEYTLLIRPTDLCRVRIYLDGRVFEKYGRSLDYVLIEE